jgi:hypothetical protein
MEEEHSLQQMVLGILYINRQKNKVRILSYTLKKKLKLEQGSKFRS